MYGILKHIVDSVLLTEGSDLR